MVSVLVTLCLEAKWWRYQSCLRVPVHVRAVKQHIACTRACSITSSRTRSDWLTSLMLWLSEDIWVSGIQWFESGLPMYLLNEAPIYIFLNSWWNALSDMIQNSPERIWRQRKQNGRTMWSVKRHQNITYMDY